MKTRKLTWQNVKETIFDKIDLFEDPIYSSYIERDIFVEIYGKLLDELDGTDILHYFSNYFEPSPVNSSIYIFINDEMRKDFYDFALELDIVLPMKEIFEGESAKEKRIRIQGTEAHTRSLPIVSVTNHTLNQPKNKINPCQKHIANKKLEQMSKTLDKIKERLETEKDLIVRSRLEKKRDRILMIQKEKYQNH